MAKIDIKRLVYNEAEKQKANQIRSMRRLLEAATPVDTGRAKASWRSDDKEIVNYVDYIEYLNEGSSQQAPSHFIERTLLASGALPNGVIVRKMIV